MSMTPIDKQDTDCLMTVEDFLGAVESGIFIDYDGYGFYATETEYSGIMARPSQVKAEGLRSGWTHVLWFNR
jgi:hypothetical protein